MKFAKSWLVALSALVFSTVALAEETREVPAMLTQNEVQFSYFNFNAYYSCSYVEGVTEAILEDLGAQDVDVYCSGGLPDTHGNWVTATFTSIRETTAEKSTRVATVTPVRLRFREACNLHETIVREVLKGFDAYDYSKRGSCWDSTGDLDYSLKVLR